MDSIILSIKPEFAEKIFSGDKRFEYRRKICSKPVQTIYLYMTSPVRKIAGEVTVIGMLRESPLKLWELTKAWSGINKEYFDQYFDGLDIASAYCLGKAERYSKYKDLEEFGVSTPPQSYIYVKSLLKF